jgi:hypothetical protein
MADPQNHLPVQRIVSGGQTGVDRGALDAAIELNLPHGGWCPLGRLAEDGFIPTKYALRQTDADGTLILYRRQMTGGTELTHLLCRRHGRPVLTVDLDDTVDLIAIRQWLVQERIVALNVAGPRESTSPGIQAAAKQLLCELFGGVT